MSGSAGTTSVPNPLAVARVRNSTSVVTRGDTLTRKFLLKIMSLVAVVMKTRNDVSCVGGPLDTPPSPNDVGIETV